MNIAILYFFFIFYNCQSVAHTTTILIKLTLYIFRNLIQIMFNINAANVYCSINVLNDNVYNTFNLTEHSTLISNGNNYLMPRTVVTVASKRQHPTQLICALGVIVRVG